MKLSLHRAIPVAAFVLSLAFVGGDCHKGVDPPPPQIDKTWHWTVDTLIYDGIGAPPLSTQIASIWGSSNHDVWAVGICDIVTGELWHFDGKRWKVVKDWPFSGIDSLGSYINDVFAVAGFDSANVFVLGFHGYDTTGSDLVLKWNGTRWSSVPWKEGHAPRGGLGYGVAVGNRVWGTSTTGHVVSYENGMLSADQQITPYRIYGETVAGLANGRLFVNVFAESVFADEPRGTRTMLFEKLPGGQWSTLEDKFMAGADYDGVGLGRGIWAVGDQLYSFNRGVWAFHNGGWTKTFSIPQMGGFCVESPSVWWIFAERKMWRFANSEFIAIQPEILSAYGGYYLVGTGWSSGDDIFVSLSNIGPKSFILHGKYL